MPGLQCGNAKTPKPACPCASPLCGIASRSRRVTDTRRLAASSCHFPRMRMTVSGSWAALLSRACFRSSGSPQQARRSRQVLEPGGPCSRSLRGIPAQQRRGMQRDQHASADWIGMPFASLAHHGHRSRQQRPRRVGPPSARVRSACALTSGPATIGPTALTGRQRTYTSPS